MLAVIYISVALLQLSFGQDISEYDIPEEVDTTSITSDYKEDVIQNIQPKLDVDDGNVVTTDDNSLSDENVENENIEALLEPVNSGGPATQGEVKITPFQCDENINESLDEDIAPENNLIVDEAVPKNIITLSSPVKAGGKVTIIANFGCDGRKNIETLQETDSKEVVDGVVPDGPSFRGPVHAQGKVSIGTHYGCGAPVGIPPFFPMPWFSTLSPIYYPSVHLPAYPIPGSYVAQYPLPITGASPVFNDPSSSEDSLEYLPVASTLANSINGSDEDQHHGMTFNGVVPACGTVSIAARF